MISSPSDLQKFKDYLQNEILTAIYPPPTANRIRSRCKKSKESRQKDIAQKSKCSNESVINSPDGRIKVKTTDQWPSCVHGVIEGKFGDETFHGTGILIGPNIVLTAGHNLYYHKKKVKASIETLRFKPAIKGKSLPFGEARVEKFFLTDDYVNEEKEDYGILILKKPIGDITGYFGLACLNPIELAKKEINIAGYPEDKVKSKPGTYQMWEMKGSIYKVDEEKGEIHYKIDTAKGQSGSGIVFEEHGEHFVCGVHVQGDEHVNIATLLTRPRYEQIYNWILESVQKESLIYLDTEYLELKDQKLDSKSISLLLEYDLGHIKTFYCPQNLFGRSGIQALAQKFSWSSLGHLNLSNTNIGDEGASLLSQNTSWANLSRLNLSKSKIGDEGAKRLGKNTSWRKLSEFDLSDNMIENEGAKRLAQNAKWVNLSQLDLSNNNIGDKGAPDQNPSWINLSWLYLPTDIGQNTSWGNLLKLSLSNNNIGDDEVKQLGKNASWMKIFELDLSNNSIGPEGAKGLAQNTKWSKLSILNLSNNNIGDKGAEGLAQNISWTSLSHLDISKNNITSEGSEGLARNKSWIRLLKLNLSKNNICDKGAKGLAENVSWVKLSHLDLSLNNIAGKGAKGLGENSSWVQLSDLNLSNNEICDKGAAGLGENTSWTNLSQLDLSNNKMNGKGVKSLGQNSSWTNLSKLNLMDNNIGDDGATKLGQNKSWINLFHLNLSNNNIGDEGALGKNSSWTKLSQLNLLKNVIGDKGSQALGQNISWRKLSELDLSWNHIADEGAEALARNSSWVSLSKLNLEGNKICDQGAIALIKMNIEQLNLAWNNINYEEIRSFHQSLALPKISNNYFDLVDIVKRTLQITGSELFLIWNTIENSKKFVTHKRAFISSYRSFVLKIISPKEFEDFIKQIEDVPHSKFDINGGEDDASIEELCASPSYYGMFFSGNRKSIEEGNRSARSNSDYNYNNKNISAE